MNINERFEKAIEKLNKNHMFLAAEVTKMGYPKLSKEIPTAGVSWNDKRKKIDFIFNPDFAKKLNDDQFCFVVLHEVIHIVNCHIFLLKNEIDKMTITEKTNEIIKFKRKMNIAMDCVVNDSLLLWYGYPEVFCAMSDFLPVYGYNTIGIDCHDMTAEEVFYMLPDDLETECECGHISWESFFDKDGNLKKEFVDQIKSFVSNNKMNSNLTDKELAEVEKIIERLKEINKGGDFFNNKLRPIEDMGKTLKWDLILSEFVQIRKIEETWAKVDKKFYGFYPKTILPSSKDAEKQEIFVAIDASGSIDYNALSLFTSLLKSIPSHIKINAISFDTNYYEYDIHKTEQPCGGGGTRINCVHEYIEKNFKKYPKCVILFTDGCDQGDFIEPIHKNKWLWLLYGNYSNQFCKTMKHFELSKFIK
jgi:predicted metal-dependent peptidase